MVKRRVLPFVVLLSFLFAGASAAPAGAAIPPNDTPDGATVLSIPSTTTGLDFTEAGVDPGEDTSCLSWWDTKTLWYRLTPAADITVRVVAQPEWSGPPAVALYTGEPQNLTPVACLPTGEGAVDLTGDTHYYLQVITPFGAPVASLSVTQVERPVNDSIDGAVPLGVGESVTADITNASREANEPSCLYPEPPATVWFAFTAPESIAYRFTWNSDPRDEWQAATAMYVRSATGELERVGGCQTRGVVATEGVTYFVQVGQSGAFSGSVELSLSPAPPPSPTITESGGPSQYVPAQLYASGYEDPLGWQSPVTMHWDLGDGTTLDGEPSVSHQFPADGDYPVTFTSTTADGRVGTATTVVHVRTHDVAVVSFSAPTTARAGQVKSLTVGLRNTRYGETVTLVLSKGTRDGWVDVASTVQYLPARPANKTTSIAIPYLFTAADAAQGSVSFRVEAFLYDATDAFDVNDTMVSTPVRVTK